MEGEFDPILITVCANHGGASFATKFKDPRVVKIFGKLVETWLGMLSSLAV